MDKVICHCGREIQKRSIDSHLKTKFHINYMKSLYVEPEITSDLIQSDDEDDKTTIKTVSLEWFDDNLKRDKPYEYAWKKKNNFI